jgi:hypothetical protein
MREDPDNFAGLVILDRPRFRVALLRNVEAQGLCAEWDKESLGHRELMVKNTNAFSEQYHVELSSGAVRGGDGAYRATCTPANFPVNPQPLPPRGDCALPSSREFGCDRVAPVFLDVIEATADEIAQSRTDIVRDGFIVGNVNDYYSEMVARLRQKGFCAIFDTEEVAVKNNNDFSVQFHVVLSNGQVRRGDGVYRSTCRPAAF